MWKARLSQCPYTNDRNLSVVQALVYPLYAAVALCVRLCGVPGMSILLTLPGQTSWLETHAL
jgi:hypothetical protein